MSPTATTSSNRQAQTRASDHPATTPYKLPVVGTTMPAGVVENGFWIALIGSAALGAVDPPLAALVGAGVLIARHRRN